MSAVIRWAHGGDARVLSIDAHAKKRLDASATELTSEREAIKELLGPAI